MTDTITSLPTLIHRPANKRGESRNYWLESYHTFSFGDYYDPANRNFGALRVINDDVVMAGQGFQPHGHQDMEIITVVLSGQLAHKDSLGNGSTIVPGEVQYMCAGTGIEHSEINPSADEDVHLLQIWIIPPKKNLPPRYGQQAFEPVMNEWQCVVAPMDDEHVANNVIRAHQDVRLYRGMIEPGQQLAVDNPNGRMAWLHVAEGELTTNNTNLTAGDGLGITQQHRLTLTNTGENQAMVLWFDLPEADIQLEY